MASGAAVDKVICAECLRKLSELDEHELARAITTPSVVPGALHATHAVCSACLSVHQVGDTHHARCALSSVGAMLTVAGWSSGISEALRYDLRRARPVGLTITTRLVASLAERALATAGVDRSSVLVVSVPTAGRGTTDPVGRLAAAVADAMGVSAIERAFVRTKREGTRGSVAQARARIASSEYTLAEEVCAELEGQVVVLLDDTVTTGHTLAALTLLLRQARATAVFPVALDRTASARLLQRVVDARAPDHCPHVADIDAT